MTNTKQTIPCPVCNAGIPFDINMLLQGAKFTCPRCFNAVSLANESKDLVKNTMEKFEEMKNHVGQMKEDNSMS